MERVLLVEPDLATSASLAHALGSAGLRADIEKTGGNAVGKLTGNSYRIAVLNRRLADFDGLSIVASLRALGVVIPMIVIDATANAERCVSALRAGADDYLPLPLDRDEFAARTTAILRLESRRGLSCGAPAHPMLHAGGITLDRVLRRVSVEGNLVRLRPTGFRLLEFMMLNAGRIITRTEMLEVLWHRRFDPGTNLVEVHIGELRRKLGDPAGASVIRTVRGAGYVFLPLPHAPGMAA